jgi:acyl-CoA thioester hydrolase
MNKKDYPNKIQIRVRTFEVDSLGIVHNSYYLNYFEIGRVEYRREAGYKILPGGVFSDGLIVVVVRNEINYRSPAHFDDILNLYTRIEWIKNSSFCFEQFIENQETGKSICDGKGVLVNIDSNGNSFPLNEKFKSELINFDKNIKLIK